MNKLKASKKNLKNKGKDLKSLWRQYKFEMKLVKDFEYNRPKLEQVYDQASIKAIESCVQALKEKGEVPLEIDIKSLCEEIDKAQKGKKGNKKEISLVKVARERGTTVKELLGISKKKKANQIEQEQNQESEQKDAETRTEDMQEFMEANIKTRDKMQKGKYTIETEEQQEEFENSEIDVAAPTWAQEDVEQNEKDTAQRPTLMQDKEQIEAKLKELKDKHIKGKEVEELEKDLARVEELLSKSQEKEQKEEKQEENKQENDFRKSLRTGIIFHNSSIDRRKIEEMQKQQNNKILKSMTPEEYMAYIGYVQTQKQFGKNVKYEEFLQQISQNPETGELYAKRAVKSLEKIEGNKSEDEIEKMSESDKFLYGIAEDYRDIQEETIEQAGQAQTR